MGLPGSPSLEGFGLHRCDAGHQHFGGECGGNDLFGLLRLGPSRSERGHDRSHDDQQHSRCEQRFEQGDSAAVGPMR